MESGCLWPWVLCTWRARPHCPNCCKIKATLWPIFLCDNKCSCLEIIGRSRMFFPKRPRDELSSCRQVSCGRPVMQLHQSRYLDAHNSWLLHGPGRHECWRHDWRDRAGDAKPVHGRNSGTSYISQAEVAGSFMARLPDWEPCSAANTLVNSAPIRNICAA